jgi:hypothetical protein
MLLVPCSSCRRHIGETEPSCPFCATPRTPTHRALLVHSGRFSRAAIFAGLAACYTSTTPQPPASPPPAHDQVARDPRDTPPPSRGGVLRGKLSDARSGAPLAGVTVEVWTTPSIPTTATTDANGDYAVRGLEAREYQVSFVGPDGVRYAASRIVELRDSDETLDLAIEPVPMAVPKPYGAPPARKRVV